MKLLLTSLLFPFVLSFGPTLPSRGAPAEGTFVDLSFDQACARAKEMKKLVMIDFFTTWCGPCKRLDAVTWPDAGVQEWMSASVVALKVDAEKNRNLARRYGVRAYPTVVFLRADGSEVGRFLGFKTPNDFLLAARATVGGKSPIELARERVATQPNDPSGRVALARELERTGELAGALEQYLWCFDHGIANDPGFEVVRQTFVLGAIARMGNRHPPATQALADRARRAESALDSGTGTAADARDLAAILTALEQRDELLAAWDRLRAAGTSSEVVEPMFEQVFTLLLDRGRYADAVAVAGDPLGRLERQLAAVRELEASPGADKRLVAHQESQAIDRGTRFFLALQGAGRPEEADAVADRVIAFESTGIVFAGLIGAARRAGADGAARALVDRGIAELPPEQQFSVRRAARELGASGPSRPSGRPTGSRD